MAKVDLMLITGLTAGDGSVVASGATMKFDSQFFASSTNVRIKPKLYRNRELFESGYTETIISEQTIPSEFDIEFSEEDFYTMTPLVLYEEVGNYLNNVLDGVYFELKIIE